MLFSSLVFIGLFLPLTLALYYLVPGKGKAYVLLLASLLFYAWGEPVYVVLMILSICFNFFCGRAMEDTSDEGKRRIIFIGTVVVDLALLGFFKYAGFVVENLNRVLPHSISYHALPLPIGISFYTFQILSYIIDVYKKRVPVQQNIVRFGVYVSMFPQLIAGPIVRYVDIDQQLSSPNCSLEQLGKGTLRFVEGLSKKVLLANTMGAIYEQVKLQGATNLSVGSAWLGIMAFAFQIYFDFSGYSDMAIGLGKMLGFEFLENFHYPYRAESVTDFWRRWHISLGTWFREYVYIPLGGNRVSKGAHIRNILVVWALTGLWHGASWNFIFWGLYYALLLLLEKYVLVKIKDHVPAGVKQLITFIMVLIGWVFFAHTDIREGFAYVKAMLGGNHVFFNAATWELLIHHWLLWILCALASGPLLGRWIRSKCRPRGTRRIQLGYIVLAVLFLMDIAFLVTDTYNPFLYFRF